MRSPAAGAEVFAGAMFCLSELTEHLWFGFFNRSKESLLVFTEKRARGV